MSEPPPTSWDALDTAQFDALRAQLELEIPDPKYVSLDYLRYMQAAVTTGEGQNITIVDASDSSKFLTATAFPRTLEDGTPARSFVAYSTAASNIPVLSELSQRQHEDGVPLLFTLATKTGATSFSQVSGWEKVARLRTLICIPLPRQGARYQHARVHAEFLGSERFETLLESIDFSAAENELTWNAELLRWRLASPNGRYILSWTDDFVGVSIRRSTIFPAALVLKIWPRVHEEGKKRTSASRLLGAIARFHGTPCVVYRGRNAHARVRGIPLWRRHGLAAQFLYCSHTQGGEGRDLTQFPTIELLDSDAY